MVLRDMISVYIKRALPWVQAIQRHKAPGRSALQGSFFSSISTAADIVKACGHMNKRGLLAESRPEWARLGGIMLHSRDSPLVSSV